MTPARRLAATAALVTVTLAGAGCGNPRPAADRPYALPVDVYADTGRGGPLRVAAPAAPPARASVWLARVSPARPALLQLPQAEIAAEPLAVAIPAPPALAVDEDLKPPLPRTRAPLTVPARARGFVELDVRVDEEGRVSDALWAGGSEDPPLVRAATDCALGMRFYPALRAGRPVAVWCRQRFDFGGGRAGENR
ncbi:MAG: energy transducer TonB [Candidatus Eisenbacteria bacterium]